MAWVKIKESEVPAAIVFEVPSRNQGQIIEYAYGAHRNATADIGNERTAPFQRVLDQSEDDLARRVAFYKRS